MEITYTDRGFGKMDIEDSRGCLCRVQRSSAADLDAIWIFCYDTKGVYKGSNPHPHLTSDQARQVAKALLAFADGEDFDE